MRPGHNARKEVKAYLHPGTKEEQHQQRERTMQHPMYIHTPLTHSLTSLTIKSLSVVIRFRNVAHPVRTFLHWTLRLLLRIR